ncbi:hypothetical protein BDZ97DRAFT_524966 [Flammula alnicola]|nr:hypothetical protein BDZ97DRAFT_524966 [Flammula alnicola]
MPQIYPRNEPRRRSSSSASSSSVSSSSTTPLRVVDADDSIVLSDLVRTGEASRLRRRGAMRIDHSAVSNARVSSPTRSLVVVERPSWDSDFDLDLSLLPEGHLGRTTSRYARRRQRPSRRFGPYATGTVAEPEEADEDVHTLVCGAEIAEYSSDESEPFKPSVLPLYPPLQHAKEKEVKRSTGCGTVVHMRATPHPRVGLWSACGTASSSVVPLEAIYFDTREAAKFVRSSCGCVKEGVGCAVCGNPLGIRYIPCKSASDSFFCGRHNDKSHATRLRGPEGPQYWQASSSHASDHTIFTFFSDAVTPTPSFEFPVQKPGPANGTIQMPLTYHLTSATCHPSHRRDFSLTPSSQTTKATPSQAEAIGSRS